MEYSISIISLLDLLGFRNVVAESKTAKEVYEILKIFRRVSTPVPELAKPYEQRFISFSDHVVRTTNILSEMNKSRQVGILFYELLDLIYLQCDLILKGVFIRGGITIGNIYLKSPYIFGQGLIKAHELESKTAIFPRIVVDPDVLVIFKKTNLLKALHHDYATELKYIKDLIRKDDDDGVIYLDYLKIISGEADSPTQFFRFLTKHKRVIIDNYKKYRENRRITAKYLWLAKYHNTVIAEMHDNYFTSNGQRKKKFMIPKRISNAG